jgi:hypothetical protein
VGPRPPRRRSLAPEDHRRARGRSVCGGGLEQRLGSE